MGDDLAELVAVDAGEVAVEDYDVVGIDVELRGRFLAVVGDVDGDPFVLQSLDERVGERAGVFHDEDSHAEAPAAVTTARGKVIATRSPPPLSAARSSSPP